MRKPPRPRGLETWEEMRARMLAETSEFLTECMRRPERAVRIPMIPAGSGEFPASLSRSFWDRVLAE